MRQAEQYLRRSDRHLASTAKLKPRRWGTGRRVAGDPIFWSGSAVAIGARIRPRSARGPARAVGFAMSPSRGPPSLPMPPSTPFGCQLARSCSVLAVVCCAAVLPAWRCLDRDHGLISCLPCHKASPGEAHILCGCRRQAPTQKIAAPPRISHLPDPSLCSGLRDPRVP